VTLSRSGSLLGKCTQVTKVRDHFRLYQHADILPEAGGRFEELIREVSAVSIVVKDLEDQAACADSLLNRHGSHKSSELKSVIDNIRVALEELKDLAEKYPSLTSIQKRKLDTFRFATKDITDIRARLAFHVQAAQSILDGLRGKSLAHIQIQNDNSLNSLGRLEAESTDTRQALARVEQLLLDKIQEVKQGSREPSVMSGDGWNIWSELRRDLQFEGYVRTPLRSTHASRKTYVKLINLMALVFTFVWLANRAFNHGHQLFDNGVYVTREAATPTTTSLPHNTQVPVASSCPELPAELGGLYWNIYSKETPCGCD
jgi:hypothetical protein